MKAIINVFAIAGLIFSAGIAQAESVVCAVETPCGWVNDDLWPGSEFLGYCVTQVTGDENTFYIHRADAQGGELLPLELKTVTFDSTRVEASSDDGTTTLNAEFGIAGALSIGKPSFFVFCEKQ